MFNGKLGDSKPALGAISPRRQKGRSEAVYSVLRPCRLCSGLSGSILYCRRAAPRDLLGAVCSSGCRNPESQSYIRWRQ